MWSVVSKVLVKTFYRQNASLFLWVFLLFFGVVSPSMQLAYHYSLILGILRSGLFLGLVALVWLLYTLKTIRAVLSTLDDPGSQFLYGLTILSPGRLFRICFYVQMLLLIPIWGYSLAVTAVAIQQHAYVTAIGVQLYMGVLCIAGAACCWLRWCHPGRSSILLFRYRRRRSPPYWSILFRYLLKEEKALVAGVKLFSCLTLYFLLRDQRPENYDLRMPFLFYSLALFGHGVILFRCRNMENTRLLFYKTLPIPLIRWFGQYGVFHFLLLLPEMLLLIWLTPHPIHPGDAGVFIISGYSLVFLLNSLLLTASLTYRNFLRLGLGIFGILYGGVLGDGLIILSGLFMVIATVLFFRGYARYERRA